MKKLIAIILLVFLAFIFCGCQKQSDETSQKQPVVINLPKDDTVNGYRLEEKKENSIPNKISGADVLPSTNSQNTNISYCGNKNTKKFHKSTCGALKNTKDENKIYFQTRDEFIQNGYNSCKLCNP